MIPDIIKESVTALVVSLFVSLGMAWKESDTQKRLLEDNMAVTKELALAVTELRVQLAVFGERYISREEFEKKIKEVR